MQPLVSVIIPAHNAAEFIAQTLTSVLKQTHNNIEAIVVDDSETNETADIANGFGDSRVRVVKTECLGASASRNTGFREAQGDFIQYLDADDLLSERKIEVQIAALLECGWEFVASCGWSHFVGQPNGLDVQPQPVWNVSAPIEWMQVSLMGGGMMQTACWLTPRSICEAAGDWNESLSLHDDGEYFTRVLLKSEQQIFVPECCVHYRKVDNSLSRRRSTKAVESAFQVCELRCRHIRDADDTSETRRALATLFAQFVYEFSDDAPELARQANQRIRELGEAPANCIGGSLFRKIRATLGWSAAMRIRRIAG